MPTLFSYDVTKEKQTEFKDWLINNKGWKDNFSNNSLPESTLIKEGTSNGKTDVLSAIEDIKAGELAVSTNVSASIVVSTSGAIDYYPQKRFNNILKR